MASAKSRDEATRDGVEAAFNYWLYDHPVSVPEIVKSAIEDAVFKWLDKHRDEVTLAIAMAVRDNRNAEQDDFQDEMRKLDAEIAEIDANLDEGEQG